MSPCASLWDMGMDAGWLDHFADFHFSLSWPLLHICMPSATCGQNKTPTTPQKGLIKMGFVHNQFQEGWEGQSGKAPMSYAWCMYLCEVHVFIYIYIFIYLFVFMHVRMYACMYVFVIYLSSHVSIYTSIDLSIYLCSYLAIDIYLYFVCSFFLVCFVYLAIFGVLLI